MDIKDRIVHQFPEYIGNEYPKFIEFVEHYYQFLDSAELKLTEISGTFVEGEEIVESSTGETASVRGLDLDNSRIFISSQRKFEVGMIVSGLVSGAFGTISSYTPNPIQSIEELLDYRDIDRTVSRFFSNFKREFMSTIPEKLASGIDKRAITKNITDLYRTKGTSEGHRLFFKMLLDENVEIYYPSEDILASSDGDWSYSTVLRLDKGSVISDVNVLVGSSITQSNKPLSSTVNKATAYVESVKTFFNGIKEVIELTLNRDSIRGTFVEGEIIRATGTDSIEYEFTLTPILVGIDVTEPGEYYNAVEKVVVSGFDYPVVALTDEISSGFVKGIDIISEGTGYVDDEPLLFNETNTLGQGTDGLVSGVHGAVSLEDGTGEIVQEDFSVFHSGIPEDKVLLDSGAGSVIDTRITRHGFNYNRLPVVTADTTGTSAVFAPVSNDIGGIQSIRIVDPGFSVTGGITAVPMTVLLVKGVVGDFIDQEDMTSSSGGTARVNKWESDISILKLEGVSGTFSVGDTITAGTTGITGTIHRNTTAVLEPKTDVLFETPGKFISEDGFVSSFAKRIQDNYYYQKFSYLVKCAESIVNWRSAVKKAVHPAGFAVFGEIKIVSKLDAKMKVPTLDATTFTPELFSTFKDIIWTVLRRRLGSDVYGTKNPNPQIGAEGARDLSVDGDYDVEVKHEYLVNWIKPWEYYNHNEGSRTGTTLYNLNKYKFIDPPTSGGQSFYYDYLLVTGTVADTYDYGLITGPESTTEDYDTIVEVISETTTSTHDYPGIHRPEVSGVGTGNWEHPDTSHEGVAGGYTIDQWGHFNISDIDTGKSKKHNVPPPSEITLRYNSWLTFTSAPPNTAGLIYFRLPVTDTYNSRTYVSGGLSGTYTVTSGQSYIVHVDGVIQPESEYSINNTVLTFTSGVPTGSTVSIREDSGTITERVYAGNGTSYTVSSEAVIIYINNVIQKKGTDYTVTGTTLTTTTSLSGTDTLIIKEFTDLINKDSTGNGVKIKFSHISNANTNNSLVYVSGVFQMPTTNYTVI